MVQYAAGHTLEAYDTFTHVLEAHDTFGTCHMQVCKAHEQ